MSNQPTQRCKDHANYAAFPRHCDACRAAAGLPTVLEDEIATMRAESASKLSSAVQLEQLCMAYPNLKRFEGRWKKVVYCSASVNARVDRFDIRHNCGCCNDSPLEIWPYLEGRDGQLNVYSDPPCFTVGHKAYDGYGDQPDDGWDTEMRAAGIPEPIIGAVSMHFRKRTDRLREAAGELLEKASVGQPLASEPKTEP